MGLPGFFNRIHSLPHEDIPNNKPKHVCAIFHLEEHIYDSDTDFLSVLNVGLSKALSFNHGHVTFISQQIDRLFLEANREYTDYYNANEAWLTDSILSFADSVVYIPYEPYLHDRDKRSIQHICHILCRKKKNKKVPILIYHEVMHRIEAKKYQNSFRFTFTSRFGPWFMTSLKDELTNEKCQVEAMLTLNHRIDQLVGRVSSFKANGFHKGFNLEKALIKQARKTLGNYFQNFDDTIVIEFSHTAYVDDFAHFTFRKEPIILTPKKIVQITCERMEMNDGSILISCNTPGINNADDVDFNIHSFETGAFIEIMIPKRNEKANVALGHPGPFHIRDPIFQHGRMHFFVEPI